MLLLLFFHNQSCSSFTLEFCCGFHLEAEGLPPEKPPSKPTLNCSKQEGGDRCFLTCQSQVHISSGELAEPDLKHHLPLQILNQTCRATAHTVTVGLIPALIIQSAALCQSCNEAVSFTDAEFLQIKTTLD